MCDRYSWPIVVWLCFGLLMQRNVMYVWCEASGGVDQCVLRPDVWNTTWRSYSCIYPSYTWLCCFMLCCVVNLWPCRRFTHRIVDMVADVYTRSSSPQSQSQSAPPTNQGTRPSPKNIIWGGNVEPIVGPSPVTYNMVARPDVVQELPPDDYIMEIWWVREVVRWCALYCAALPLFVFMSMCMSMSMWVCKGPATL